MSNRNSHSHYGNIHREHRKIIDEASKNITSRNFKRKNDAIDSLFNIVEDDDLKQYHRALICGLLAEHGDPYDFEIGDYAQQCIDACYEIIKIEGLIPESNARQPFEDLIHGARIVLNQLNMAEIEKKQYEDLQDCLRQSGPVQGDEWSEEDEMDAENELEEEYDDTVRQARGDVDIQEEQCIGNGYNALMQIDEDYEAISDEDEDEDEPNVPLKQSVYLDISMPRSSDPKALENRITAAPGYEIQHRDQEDGTFFEREVEMEDARLIQVFVLLILQYGHPCRKDMENFLDRYATEKMVEKERLLEQMHPKQLEFGGLVIRTKPRLEEIE